MRWLSLILLCSQMFAPPMFVASTSAADNWPPLPQANASVDIPAQEWPARPGPRQVRIRIHFPAGSIGNVTTQTGLMLTLHNWGGTDCVGTADPDSLANELDVIAICVNYLQSGRQDSIEAPEPYDFGHLQALDALRALWYVRDQLQQRGIAFNDGRVYCTGGSGGGNVTLMANKLAPRTFACIVDMCGMKKLSDDIAFHLPGGSDLNARWNRDRDSPGFLSVDEQELRFVGHPEHLGEMKQSGGESRVVVVHGVDDRTCPFEDAVEMVDLMQQAGLNVEPHWIDSSRVDGKIFTSAGHALGNRTQIVLTVAGRWLKPDSPDCLRRRGATDFDRRDAVTYATTNGRFEISYESGFPVSRFVRQPAVPEYRDHSRLDYWLDELGSQQPISTVEDWQHRKRHILRNFERVAGSLPSVASRVPLKTEILEEVRLDPPQVQRPLLRRKIRYQSDGNDQVPAYLFLPVTPDLDSPERLPAVLCLQQTTEFGKDEPAGIRGDSTMKYALELAERGFITLAPDYPSFGEHSYDFAPIRGYQSGSMKAVWDNIRAVDVLVSLPEVDADRIGCIGHSLGGHNAVFTSIFEPRIRAIVCSCGFTGLKHDDLPSWTGPRYFPKIATEFENSPAQMPFDFHELIACLAPRPLFVCAAEQDNDFDVNGVREVIQAAAAVYARHGAESQLQAVYPPVPHSFPDETRAMAYQFLETHLRVDER